MSTGKVKMFNGEKNFGFIRCRETEEDVHFRGSALKGDLRHTIQPGVEVEFELTKQPDGRYTALDVRLKGDATQYPTPRGRQTERTEADKGTHRFLNPYNFVRCIPALRPEGHVLGDAPPPPHDRRVGLSGKITCELEALTPLFTSDAHRVTFGDDKKTHKVYRFLQAWRKDEDGNARLEEILSGSSLRGMVRQVYEAVTNSCFAVFDYDMRLSYRLPMQKAPRLVPARVERNEKGSFQLTLFTGTSGSRKTKGARFQPAAWVPFYEPIKRSRTQASAPGHPYSGRLARSKLDPSSYVHARHYWARMEEMDHPDERKRLKFWNVVELAEDRSQLSPPARGEIVAEGYLCITNQNIDNKHDERFFFHDPSSGQAPFVLSLDKNTVEAYNTLLKDYQERHQNDVKKRKPNAHLRNGDEPGFSRFIANQHERLGHEELVYAGISEYQFPKPHFEIDYIVPVMVPRLFYESAVAELIPEKLEAGLCKCSNGGANLLERLCPACRLFGWVFGRPNADESGLSDDAAGAYRGRVQFSHAELVEKKARKEPLVLAILSAPKPTTSRFYLLDADGQPIQGKDDEASGYDGKNDAGLKNQLRGRKVYRHHARPSLEEYQRKGLKRDDQNRTLEGVLEPGTRFTFDVHFENLAKEELGGLLWCLELEKEAADGQKGWCHRFGLGRPLGFGSVRVWVRGIERFDPLKRYQPDLDSTGIESITEHKESLIDTFKQALSAVYGKDFDLLPPVQDMKALLSEKQPELPVHYPRSSPEPELDGKNFKWFMGNKKRREALPLACGDEKGFRLLNEKGEIV